MIRVELKFWVKFPGRLQRQHSCKLRTSFRFFWMFTLLLGFNAVQFMYFQREIIEKSEVIPITKLTVQYNICLLSTCCVDTMLISDRDKKMKKNPSLYSRTFWSITGKITANSLIWKGKAQICFMNHLESVKLLEFKYPLHEPNQVT